MRQQHQAHFLDIEVKSETVASGQALSQAPYAMGRRSREWLGTVNGDESLGVNGGVLEAVVMEEVPVKTTSEWNTGGRCRTMRIAVEPLVDGAADSLDLTPSLRSGMCADAGPRYYMEDTHVQIDNIDGFLGTNVLAQPSAFYGVFDGHSGEGAARYVQEHMLRLIVEDPAFPEEMAGAMKGAYLRADEALEGHWLQKREGACSGTTALAVFISGRTLVVANAGDCRAVLSRRGKHLELSTDQRACSGSELARIKAAGGFIQDGSLNGELGVARAIGDWHLESLKRRDAKSRQVAGPLIALPEVREVELGPGDEFLILGSDGLWDKLGSQVAVDFARRRLQQHNSPQRCSQELVDEALRLRTGDNVTALVVCFQEGAPPNLRGDRSGVQRCISINGLQRLQGHIDVAGCSRTR
eukprot:jgi/Mesen1/8836/ME000053S08239